MSDDIMCTSCIPDGHSHPQVGAGSLHSPLPRHSASLTPMRSNPGSHANLTLAPHRDIEGRDMEGRALPLRGGGSGEHFTTTVCVCVGECECV